MNEGITKERCAELRARAKSIAKYHSEFTGYGGVSREFHAYAETMLGTDVPLLLDEVERLGARLREADAEVDRVRKHLSYETESRLRVQVILGSFGCECSTEQAIICLRCALVKEISTR